MLVPSWAGSSRSWKASSLGEEPSSQLSWSMINTHSAAIRLESSSVQYNPRAQSSKREKKIPLKQNRIKFLQRHTAVFVNADVHKTFSFLQFNLRCYTSPKCHHYHPMHQRYMCKQLCHEHCLAAGWLIDSTSAFEQLRHQQQCIVI